MCCFSCLTVETSSTCYAIAVNRGLMGCIQALSNGQLSDFNVSTVLR